MKTGKHPMSSGEIKKRLLKYANTIINAAIATDTNIWAAGVNDVGFVELVYEPSTIKGMISFPVLAAETVLDVKVHDEEKRQIYVEMEVK